MNTRINELVKKAMTPSGVEGIGGSYLELNPEKLAELILKECIAQLDIPSVPTPIQAGLNLAKHAIKEHFGI